MSFRIWAPHATRDVTLELGSRTIPMRSRDAGWWEAPEPRIPGDRYAVRIDGGPPLPDPRSLSQPDGPHGRSEVIDLQRHQWGDDRWPGADLHGAVLYELHLGTFTAKGDCDAAIDRMDHLAALGVTMIEIMPVAAFPGSRGWGYDGVCPYAVHAAYGGAEGLQRLVDACHRRDIAVCLDVVYNHLGPSGNYLGEFGPYFTDRYATPWGAAVNLDGPGSDEVRRYFLDNARMWLRDFHIDALRLDAVHELHDGRALTFLEELASEVDALSGELGRPLTLIAESDRNDPATVTDRSSGGIGLRAQWADDVHHSVHTLLTGETQGYYVDFAGFALGKTWHTPFFHDGTWSSFRGRHHGRPVDATRTPGDRFVASLQTHDQVGNRAAGDRLSNLVPAGRLACAAAILLTSPYTPMLFMGEEWGASTPWKYFTDHQEPELARAVSEGRRAEFAEHGLGSDVTDPQDPVALTDSVLDWDEIDAGPHAALLHWYRTLIALRRQTPDLHDGDLSGASAELTEGVLRLQRGDHIVLANLGDDAVRVAGPPRHTPCAQWGAQIEGHGVMLPPDTVVILAPDGRSGSGLGR